MNNLSVFDFKNHQVRVITDNPACILFVVKDVAIALGYKDTKNAIKQHCKGVAKHHPLKTKRGDIQQVRVIDEPDLYRLIFGSHLKTAVAFQDWVFEDVLPSIRQNGTYTHPNYRPEKTRKALVDGLTIEQQDAIKAYHKQLVSQVPKAQQAKMAIGLWSAVKSKFGVTYKLVPSSEYVNILSLMGRVAVEMQQKALPAPDNSQMFYGLRDGRYVVVVDNGQTIIKDIKGCSIVDRTFTDAIRKNFGILSQQMRLLSGEESPTVLDMQMEMLPNVH